MSRRKRIGILTGGGDCPGLNAVIRAVVLSAVDGYGWEVLGVEDGFDGLLNDRIRNVTEEGFDRLEFGVCRIQ